MVKKLLFCHHSLILPPALHHVIRLFLYHTLFYYFHFWHFKRYKFPVKIQRSKSCKRLSNLLIIQTRQLIFTLTFLSSRTNFSSPHLSSLIIPCNWFLFLCFAPLPEVPKESWAWRWLLVVLEGKFSAGTKLGFSHTKQSFQSVALSLCFYGLVFCCCLFESYKAVLGDCLWLCTSSGA